MEVFIKKIVNYSEYTKDWYNSWLIIDLYSKRYHRKKEYDYLAAFALIKDTIIKEDGKN